MQLEHLNYFLTVVKYGSISKAGKYLHLDQPNLSKIISNLESDLGTKLFERSTRGVSLTEHGQQTASWAQDVLEGQEMLKARFAADAQRQKAALCGQLSIYMPINIAGDAFHQLAADFSAAYPNVSIYIAETSVRNIIKAVSLNPNAIGMLIYFDSLYQDALTDDLLLFPLSELVPVVYAAKDSQFARQHKTTSLSAIVNEPIVIYKPSLLEPSSAEDLLMLYGNYNIKFTVSNLFTFYNVLKQGKHITLGISRKDPLSTISELIEIPLRDKIRGFTGLLVTKTAASDPLVRTFARFYYTSKNMPIPEVLLS